MKRRNFLGVILGSLGSITFASFGYSLFRLLTSAPAKAVESKEVIIAKVDVPYGGSKNITFGDIPVVVINRPEKGYIAFSRTCTHFGCLVDFNKDRQKIICPCHAGTYDLDGTVLSGPPPKPLTRIPVKIEGENLIVG